MGSKDASNKRNTFIFVIWTVPYFEKKIMKRRDKGPEFNQFGSAISNLVFTRIAIKLYTLVVYEEMWSQSDFLIKKRGKLFENRWMHLTEFKTASSLI